MSVPETRVVDESFDFREGDVVKLISGGPRMTVVDGRGRAWLIHCYFKNGIYFMMTVRGDALRLVHRKDARFSFLRF